MQEGIDKSAAEVWGGAATAHSTVREERLPKAGGSVPLSWLLPRYLGRETNYWNGRSDEDDEAVMMPR